MLSHARPPPQLAALLGEPGCKSDNLSSDQLPPRSLYDSLICICCYLAIFLFLALEEIFVSCTVYANSHSRRGIMDGLDYSRGFPEWLLGQSVMVNTGAVGVFGASDNFPESTICRNNS